MTSVLLLAPSVARYRHESLDTADMSCDVTLHLHLIAYNTLKGKKAETKHQGPRCTDKTIRFNRKMDDFMSTSKRSAVNTSVFPSTFELEISLQM